MDTIAWRSGRVCLLDQTRIPAAVETLECASWEAVVDAIVNMVVRGAPAIGCTAALGLAQAARETDAPDMATFRAALGDAAAQFRASRPTAVNLFWAVDRIMAVAGLPHPTVDAARAAIEAEALRMLDEDVAANRALGAHGASLLPDAVAILTHCNAGALATAGYGTALGVIRAAVEAGKRVKVFADETRPRFQGARLTAFELARDGVDVTVIADNMAGSLMRAGRIDCAVVGADRIAANGDTANKVGTYGVAVLCRHHGIPFYVAAPLSTVDFTLPDGSGICIEERSHSEMTHLDGVPITPAGVQVINPSFDVTPFDLIDAIVTERGVARPPYAESLRRLAQGDAP